MLAEKIKNDLTKKELQTLLEGKRGFTHLTEEEYLRYCELRLIVNQITYFRMKKIFIFGISFIIIVTIGVLIIKDIPVSEAFWLGFIWGLYFLVSLLIFIRPNYNRVYKKHLKHEQNFLKKQKVM